MEFRPFGRTGLRISAIGFGCWEIGGTYGRIDESDFQRAVAQGIDSGITCFDSAEAIGMGVSTTEAAIAEMRARGGGALLHTASSSGLVGSGFSPVYSMAKFGVVGFARALAKRLSPDNVRVNAVCPARSTRPCCASLSPDQISNRRQAIRPRTRSSFAAARQFR